MYGYFRNHQLYLSERSAWQDRHVLTVSKRALMKIDSWKMFQKFPDSRFNPTRLKKLIIDSLLTVINNKEVLAKEGYYASNMDN